MKEKKPPFEIDGAMVLEWAWSGDTPFGTMKDRDGNIVVEVFGFAICRYEETGDIYRFSCNQDWESENDAPYNSVEEAKAAIPPQYDLVKPVWNGKNRGRS